MASLVYDLPIAGFDARPFERAAEYVRSGDFGQFSVRLTEDELLGEFGVVPQSIRVVLAQLIEGGWIARPSDLERLIDGHMPEAGA